MLKKHYSLIHADKILKLIQESRKLKGTDVFLESWSNCREQGYSLLLDTILFSERRRINFAQARNSDEIVVLEGTPGEFDITTNMPEKTVWDKRKYFQKDKDAVNEILRYLLGGLR